MPQTILIKRGSTPTDRQLELIDRTLYVMSSCCCSEMVQRGGSWVCLACKEIDAAAMWAATVKLTDAVNEKREGWNSWFGFWFDLHDVDISWEWS